MTAVENRAAPPDRLEVSQVPVLLPRLISATLKGGIAVSAALILVGLGVLATGSAPFFVSQTVHGAPFSLSGFVRGLAQGQAVDLLLLGFLVLILTPLVRVVLSSAMFAAARDRPFTILTVSVLVVLGVSVVVGVFP